MRTTFLRSLAVALALFVAGCLLLSEGRRVAAQTPASPPASAPPATTPPAKSKESPAKSSETPPGVVVAETTTLRATVEAVDPATREVTLKGPKGKIVTIKAGRSEERRVGKECRAQTAREQ